MNDIVDMGNTTKLKCVCCGMKWEVNYKEFNDDLDIDTTCPDCHWAASAWNFILEAGDK